MRLFGGDRINSLMDTLRIDENTPIDNGMISNSVESAQKKLESRNFAIRKHVLEYDDVMNQQRKVIYSQRNEVLKGADIHESIWKMVEGSIHDVSARYLSGENGLEWNLNGLREYYMGWLTDENDFKYTNQELEDCDKEYIVNLLIDRAKKLYAQREEEIGSDRMREVERIVLLRMVDTKWMDHIDAMEELKRGITLRAYGQRDPVVEYRLEGSDMFDDMVASIREDTARKIYENTSA